MLKSKRNKTKSKERKTKTKNIEDDEEILSVSSVESQPEEQAKTAKTKGSQIKHISADERRLQMANSLIQTLTENEENDIEEHIKKTKSDFCEERSKRLNMVSESSFIRCHLSCITSVNFIDDIKVITTSKDSRCFIVDLITEKKQMLPEFTNSALMCSAVSSNNKNVVFAGKDKKIYLYNIESNKILSVLPKAHTDTITGIKFDPDNEQVYSVSKDNNMKVWALNNFNNLIYMETFYGHTGHIWDIDVLSSNRILTCGNDKNMHQWKIDAQSFLQYKQGNSQIDCISAISKNHFYAGDYDGKLKLYSIDKKKSIAEILNTDNKEAHCPIVSLHAVRNTDIVFTGGINGQIRAYKANYSKNVNHIESVGSLTINQTNGIVSCINSNSRLLVAGFSKDAKNGRWDTDYSLKHHGIAIVKVYS